MRIVGRYSIIFLSLLWSCTSGEKETNGGPFAGLPVIQLPAEFPAGPDAPPPATPVLKDSAFVVQFLNPTYFQEEEPQYHYHQGLIVMKKNKFTAIAFPISHGFGYDYRLYTYTPSGQLLDTLTLAETAGDSYEQSARMDAKGKIRTKRVYLDDSRHPLMFAYSITSEGKIEQVPVIKPRGSGWLNETGEQ
ncbi:MAG: hypothetical protein KDD02_17280 [Phaeodactylibacter sp.]|nr:hypothetical protein [Phaeodactylibacter sp.]MCB9300822.1 hypothetical protein [Lewinellaceae bacterium]